MRLWVMVGILSMMGLSARAQCGLPSQFANFEVVYENDLEITFATEQWLYVQGDTVRFYLIVKNVGQSVFSINWGIDPQDAIFVMPPPCTTVTPACFETCVFYHPTFLYFYSAGTTLDPGECRVWERSWDTNERPAAPGSYSVLGGMFQPTLDGNIGVFEVPTIPIVLNVMFDAPIPADESTWGRIKELFR